MTKNQREYQRRKLRVIGERTCAWPACGQRFSVLQSHPKQACCSPRCAGRQRAAVRGHDFYVQLGRKYGRLAGVAKHKAYVERTAAAYMETVRHHPAFRDLDGRGLAAVAVLLRRSAEQAYVRGYAAGWHVGANRSPLPAKYQPAKARTEAA